jgi:hypothetical protein
MRSVLITLAAFTVFFLDAWALRVLSDASEAHAVGFGVVGAMVFLHGMRP